jgi:hypothetical protein
LPPAARARPAPGSSARWYGIIGTGQSLAVGTTPFNPTATQTDYGNLKLAVGLGVQPPFDPMDPALAIARAHLEIESVTLGENSVQITCAAEIPAGAIVGYAVTSDGTTQPGLGHRWGQLRDSDPFVGATTGAAQPNYLVAFELPVPAAP